MNMSMNEKEVAQMLAEILGLSKKHPLEGKASVNQPMADEINRLTKECWKIFDTMIIDKPKHADIIFCTCITVMLDILNRDEVPESGLPFIVAQFQARMRKFFRAETYKHDDNTPNT
jgi:hypothetical protein